MQGKLILNHNDHDYLYLDSLIPKEHFLRKVNSRIELSFIGSITEDLYCPNNGRPSIAPELYFRIMLLGYLFSIKSTRKLMEQIQYNIAYRWFCGLSLKDKIPHHASLSRIKKRLKKDIFEQVFFNIVSQCEQAGLMDGQSIMADSTFIQANASLNSMNPIDENSPRNRRPNEARENSKWQLSNKTHRSKTDPDASLAFKTGTARSLKYKAHVCCDSKNRVITDILVTTGSTHDSQPFIGLIKKLKTKLSYPVSEVIADRAYGSGTILSFLKDYKIRSFIPLFTTRTGNNSTELEGITYDYDQETYICRNNVPFHASKVSSQGFITYRTRVKDCRNCSLAGSCQAPIAKGRGIRVMSRHIHDDIFKQVKKEMETDIFKQKLRERLWKIEGVMNELKNQNGLLRAQSRGIENVQKQAYLAAIAINIKRLVFFVLIIISLR
ncbi:IS1182 family transposase [Legionella israelensis]|uniref:Transposase n=1 Tax=Legionella israelensis TaxID=454 RepID=A0A0W0V3W8_9GAMM|nr:IS1182 family transposase [Legionella israelensis]KTD14377.1 transposase [Legionella israelensis]QBS09801.1 IS1182 family transposase [Legionella israelensis]SCY10844.1 Transposase [Legionella israelensis DSM 19235]STX59351.1 transposase [Legionella israelensis]